MFCLTAKTTIANEPDLSEIEKTEEGYLFSEEQVIELADYIEELRTENEKLETQLDQAKEEIEKSYDEESYLDLRTVSNYLTGAGIASLIIMIANAQ
ncbi:MAG: hypothetical protein ACOC3B_02960 [Bacillota bacterium]